MKPINYILIGLVVIFVVWDIILNIQKENLKADRDRIRTEKELLRKELDSLQNVSKQLQHEGEVLLRLYQIAKKDREVALQEAKEAQKKLRYEKSKPVIRYTDIELDSIRAKQFGQH